MPTVELTAGTIEYADTGAGPVVVLLHGLLMDQTLWDAAFPHLPEGHRYVRPVLPLGGHRTPMHPGADLSLHGLVRLVAELLDALDLHDVTLVHTDWGGALFLTALGLDDRVGRLVILPCEAWENFPPGLPGRMAALAARMPGGIALAARQVRVPWLRRTPLLFGQMAKRPIPDTVARSWTEGVLTSPGVRRDLRAYAASRFDRDRLVDDTDALARFEGPALVAWSPENRVMPPEHGHRLARLLPQGRLVEVEDAFVLSMLDRPECVAGVIGDFLRETAD